MKMSMDSPSRLSLCLPLLGLLACTKPAEIPTWSLSAPVASIGTVDGDSSQILHQVVAVHEAEDQKLFVLQFGSPSVAVFDSAGNRVATLGGAGAGPSNLSMPSNVQTSDTSVWIGDARAGKIVRFGSELEFREASTVRTLLPRLAARFARIDLMGIAPGGAPVAVARNQDSVYWFVGDVATPIVSGLAGGGTGRARIGDGMMTFVQPFRVDPIIATDPDREIIISLNRATDSLELEVLSVAGESPATRYAISSDGRPVPEEIVQARVDSFAEYYRGRGLPMSEVRNAIRDAMHVPERTHGVTGLLVTRDSMMAIVADDPSSQGHVARVFLYRTGEPVGAFMIPPRSRLVSLSRRHAWLLERDSFDVEHLVKRHIIKQ